LIDSEPDLAPADCQGTDLAPSVARC